MIIDRLDAFLVRLPLARPFVISDTTIDECETVFLRMESEDCVGWSEVTPGNSPNLTAEWSRGVFHAIQEIFMPVVAEQGFVADGESLDKIFAPYKGNHHAKAAFDLALWDIIAKSNNEPLWKSLGGSKNIIEVGCTFDRMEDQDLFFKDLKRLLDEHYQRLTLKLRPGWDIQVVGATRAETPPLFNIQIDVEGALDMDSHSEIMSRLEDFMPSLIEQPFAASDYVGLAMYQDSTRIPLALDESIQSLQDANIALDLQSGHLFCIKPGRVGGHTEAMKIINEANRHEVTCYGGFDLQSSIGYRHLLALASLSNFTLPCDYLRFDEVFQEDPGKQILSMEYEMDSPTKKTPEGIPVKEWHRGVELWDEPGIGCEPDESLLQKYEVEHASWSKK